MKNKKMIQLLKKYAKDNTRETFYYAVEKYSEPRLDEEGQIVTGAVVKCKTNHLRGVKKAFKRYGMQGAMAYLTVYKKEKTDKDTSPADGDTQ